MDVIYYGIDGVLFGLKEGNWFGVDDEGALIPLDHYYAEEIARMAVETDPLPDVPDRPTDEDA